MLVGRTYLVARETESIPWVGTWSEVSFCGHVLGGPGERDRKLRMTGSGRMREMIFHGKRKRSKRLFPRVDSSASSALYSSENRTYTD